jgi:tetratricopeptide (TPR) repeat protein
VSQHQDPTFLTFEQIDAILEQSVEEILRHEDPQQYFAWMRGKAPECFGHLPFIDKSGPAAIAAAAARSIWNATPLPGHQFRPRPLPPPERNAPCPCGSGVKYKHCCAGLPDLDMGHTEDLWPWVIRRLTPATLTAALEHRRIPGWALAAVARLFLEEGYNRKAAELLEPLFGGDLPRLDGRFEEALDVLCDAYLDLGYDHKRMALLERIAEKGSKELARAAHERMASMLFDRGERDAAWESFRRAQRADPDNPSLVLNEVTLLVAEHRFEEASARAKFWVAKLRKSGRDYDGLIEALEEMARDPARAVADSYLEGEGLDAARLRKWVESLRQRPLPDYRLSEPEPIDLSSPERAREQLSREIAQMGIPPEEQERAVGLLMADLKRMDKEARREAEGTRPDAAEPDSVDEADPPNPRGLLAPGSVRQLEEQWRSLFPAAKPDLTDLASPDADTWDPELWEAWLDFLEANPQAGDSLDILDDVAAAMCEEEMRMPDSLRGTLMAPLAERGHAIVARALGAQAVTLPWQWLENRPGLRLSAQLIGVCLDQRDKQRAVELMQWMLRINPHDNHGYRLVLIEELLRQERNDEALALITAYPGDMHPETAYSEVLAHLRAGHEDNARAALERALQSNRHVPEFLCEDRVQAPKLLAHTVTFGGKDQAWFYREDARDLWLATPGSLDWLGRTASALRQEQPGLFDRSAGRNKRRRRGGGAGSGSL